MFNRNHSQRWRHRLTFPNTAVLKQDNSEPALVSTLIWTNKVQIQAYKFYTFHLLHLYFCVLLFRFHVLFINDCAFYFLWVFCFRFILFDLTNYKTKLNLWIRVRVKILNMPYQLLAFGSNPSDTYHNSIRQYRIWTSIIFWEFRYQLSH